MLGLTVKIIDLKVLNKLSMTLGQENSLKTERRGFEWSEQGRLPSVTGLREPAFLFLSSRTSPDLTFFL